VPRPSAAMIVNPTSALVLGATVLGYLLWKEKQKNKTNSSRSNASTKNGDDNNECIYLDYNGTTPIYPFVIEAMMPYLKEFYGNPSSSHAYGQEPRKAVNRARRQILSLLHESKQNFSTQDEESIWFTSCGTESDNMAIQLALQSTKHLFKNQPTATRPHIVTCNIEHPAIELPLKVLQDEEQSCEVTFVPVQQDGRVAAKDIIAAIGPQTVLVTLMLANNETGALQPVKEVAEYCRSKGILFHTDAAQATGKVSVDLKTALGQADMVSLVGHKLGAPKGIACLYVRPGCLTEEGRKIHSHGVMLLGGGQEFARRGGTENVPYIVGFGEAAAHAAREWRSNAVHMEQLRGRLLEKLQTELANEATVVVKVNGPESPELRLPNTLSVGIAGVHSGSLLSAISNQVAASAGATCHSAAGISSVLRAMNVPTDLARGTLRLSVGPRTTFEEVGLAASIISQEAKRQLVQKV